jgi:hypothetical protein
VGSRRIGGLPGLAGWRASGDDKCMPEDDDHPAPPPPSGGDIDRVEVRQKQTMRLLAGIAGAGLVASIAFAAQFGTSKFVSVFATALMLAAGSAMGGVLLGFLFALPRARRSEAYAREQPSPSQPAATELTSEREATTRPNTNLEDISDWLTKILVGVGLIELASIGEALGRLSSAVAPALRGSWRRPVWACTHEHVRVHGLHDRIPVDPFLHSSCVRAC